MEFALCTRWSIQTVSNPKPYAQIFHICVTVSILVKSSECPESTKTGVGNTSSPATDRLSQLTVCFFLGPIVTSHAPSQIHKQAMQLAPNPCRYSRRHQAATRTLSIKAITRPPVQQATRHITFNTPFTPTRPCNGQPQNPPRRLPFIGQ